MKKFKPSEYAAFDKVLKYKEDKKACIEKFNRENKTNYKFITEFINFEYEKGKTAKQVADIIEITTDGVFKNLYKMEIKTRGKDGKNNIGKGKLNAEAARIIRARDSFHTDEALLWCVSAQTIGNIRRRTGKWALI